MAKAKTAYEPEAQYDLRVTRAVVLGRFRHLPRDAIVATGAVLNTLIEQEGADAIRTAVKK